MDSRSVGRLSFPIRACGTRTSQINGHSQDDSSIAGIDRVNADLPRSQFLRQDMRDDIHSTLGGGIDDRRGRRDPRRRRADINDAPALRSEQFRCFLSRQEEAKHIRVELLMEFDLP